MIIRPYDVKEHRQLYMLNLEGRLTDFNQSKGSFIPQANLQETTISQLRKYNGDKVQKLRPFLSHHITDDNRALRRFRITSLVKDKRYSWLRLWSIQYPRGHFVTAHRMADEVYGGLKNIFIHLL